MTWATPPTERAIACNGELIQYFRKQRGWTQQELASVAGYTKRLIAKAEAGGSLSPDTIEILAQTFSNSNQAVHPEDLVTSPRELAGAYMRAYARHEAEMVAHCRPIFSRDLKVYIPGGPAAAPLSGVHDGIEAFDEFCHNFFRVFQRPDKTLAEETAVFAADGNRIIVAFFERVANDNIPPDVPATPIVLHMHFSKGKLSSVQHLFDNTEFGLVITMWRETIAGQLEHRPQQFMELPRRNDAG